MLTSPSSTCTIEKIQERALRLLFDDYTKSYEELLEMADKPLVAIKIHFSN